MAVAQTSKDLSLLHVLRRQLEERKGDLEAALRLIAETTVTLTRATGAAIVICSEGACVCRASCGTSAPPTGTPIQDKSGLTGECLSAGQVLYCSDTEVDKRVDQESCRNLGVRSLVAVPLKQDGKITGVLEVLSSDSNAFQEADIATLGEIALLIVEAVARCGAGVIRESRAPRYPVEQLWEAATSPPVSHWRRYTAIVISILVLAAAWGGWSRYRSLRKIPVLSVALTRIADAQQVAAPGTSVEDLAQLKKAAADSDPRAQYSLGLRYLAGEGVEQNNIEGARYVRAAAEQGSVAAQNMLGGLYWAGRGVTQDNESAYMWSVIAAETGDEASKVRIKVLEGLMSSEEIEKARTRSSEWLASHRKKEIKRHRSK